LFVAGLASGPSANTQGMALGAVLGLAGGVVLGCLIYFGLSRVKPHQLFAVTNALILVLAAAIASQLARALAQAGLVDAWSSALWIRRVCCPPTLRWAYCCMHWPATTPSPRACSLRFT
jgi:high-affinity iron transporter